MSTSTKQPVTKDDGESDVIQVISAMPESDRTMGGRLHTIIKTNALTLKSRTWYGMPAYTDGNKIICFFRSRKKFGERYMTLGFNDIAKLDDGNIWPIYYAITKLTATEEAHIATLVKKAAS